MSARDPRHRFKLSEIQHALETASAGEDGYLKGIVVNDVDSLVGACSSGALRRYNTPQSGVATGLLVAEHRP